MTRKFSPALEEGGEGGVGGSSSGRDQHKPTKLDCIRCNFHRTAEDGRKGAKFRPMKKEGRKDSGDHQGPSGADAETRGKWKNHKEVGKSSRCNPRVATQTESRPLWRPSFFPRSPRQPSWKQGLSGKKNESLAMTRNALSPRPATRTRQNET